MRYPFDVFAFGTRYGVKGSSWKVGWHSGLDMKSKNYGGDGKVHPIYVGQVVRVTTTGSYGKCVYIRHADGYMSLYAHLASINVTVGQPVTEKTVIGIEGSTGNSTGVHLHIEVHYGDYQYPAKIDPEKFINDRSENEVIKQIKIELNGKVKVVDGIEKDGNNYIKLQDLRDDRISISYQNGRATVQVIK